MVLNYEQNKDNKTPMPKTQTMAVTATACHRRIVRTSQNDHWEGDEMRREERMQQVVWSHI
jgi:hypothetical protein